MDDRNERFVQLMLPHLDAAYNLAHWLVRDATLAQDIVADACERACRYFASFHGESARVWLLRIVRNAAYTTLQGERRRMQVPLDVDAIEDEGGGTDAVDPGPGPEERLLQREELGHLDAALAALAPSWRECLILREVEGFSYKEIARIMDAPIGTVMSRLARARRALLCATGRPPREARLAGRG